MIQSQYKFGIEKYGEDTYYPGRCVVDTGSTYREPIAIVIELNCVSKPNIYNLIY